MSDEGFGPALPPHMLQNLKDPTLIEDRTNIPKKRKLSCSSTSSDSSSDLASDSSSGSDQEECKRSRKSKEDSSLVKKSTLKVYGSARVPGSDGTNSFIGPMIPLGFSKSNNDDDDDLDDWGPKPAREGVNELEATVNEIDERAQRMKNKLLNQDLSTNTTVTQRESWMTELPPEHGAQFGLTARKFSMATSSGVSDRSVWTDTPEDRARKEMELATGIQPPVKVSSESIKIRKRDLEYSKQLEEFNKSHTRSKSLLELHTEKKTKEHTKKHKKDKHKDKKKKHKSKDKEKHKKKKRERKSESPVRRPFDRDVDLKVCQIDDAKRKAIIKRSQQLTSRFVSGGTTGMFL